MSQAFARFGSKVYLLERFHKILEKEDADAAERVQASMIKDGVNFIFGTTIKRVEKRGFEKVLHLDVKGKPQEVVVDEILVGVGRAPNT
jgi:pyruvate/2-oxoglutarate dehydrogenase complex dihydrolipoamide dehydrogenase (E3) component